MFLLVVPLAQAQNFSLRPQTDLELDASWAAHEAKTKIEADGLQGLIAEIKECYATSKKPAYRCSYLDVAASQIDSSTAAALGLSTHYTDDFFNPDVAWKRVIAPYNAIGVSEQIATKDITDALLVMDGTPNHGVDSSIPPASQAHQIPSHCKAEDGRADATQQIPSILKVNPSAASISDIEFLADEPRVMYYPAVNSEKALNMLQCPLRITWSNGHQDIGYYEEWTDHYGQVQVYFGKSPYQPQ